MLGYPAVPSSFYVEKRCIIVYVTIKIIDEWTEIIGATIYFVDAKFYFVGVEIYFLSANFYFEENKSIYVENKFYIVEIKLLYVAIEAETIENGLNLYDFGPYIAVSKPCAHEIQSYFVGANFCVVDSWLLYDDSALCFYVMYSHLHDVNIDLVKNDCVVYDLKPYCY